MTFIPHSENPAYQNYVRAFIKQKNEMGGLFRWDLWKRDARTGKLLTIDGRYQPTGEFKRILAQIGGNTAEAKDFTEKALTSNPKFDLTFDIIDDYETVRQSPVRKEKNTANEVWGLPGSGKTYTAGTYQSILFPNQVHNFNIRSIMWITDELLRRASEFPKGNVCLIRDEQPGDYGAGVFSRQAELQNMTESLRQQKISFFFVSPERKDQISRGILHYSFQTICKDYYGHFAKACVREAYGNIMGYVIVPIWDSIIDVKGVEIYEKAKKEFMSRVQNREGTADGRTAQEREDEYFKVLNFIGTKGDTIGWCFANCLNTKGNIEKQKLARLINIIYPHFQGGVSGILFRQDFEFWYESQLNVSPDRIKFPSKEEVAEKVKGLSIVPEAPNPKVAEASIEKITEEPESIKEET